MQSERLTVAYVKVNNCFAYLSDTWLRKLKSKENVIELVHNGNVHYVSCLAKPSPIGTLCLSSTFARSIQIGEGDEVFVSSVKDVPSLTSITAVPYSTSDREILELQMEKVQSTLLNQIRVVAKDQPVVIWVSKFSYVTLKTDSLQPNFRFGKLAEFTEVRVADAFSRTKSTNGKPASVFANFQDTLAAAFSFGSKGDQEDDKRPKDQEFLRSFRRKSKPAVYRVHRSPKIPSDSCNQFDLLLNSPYNVFVAKNHLPSRAFTTDGFAIFRIKKLQEERHHVDGANTNFLRSDGDRSPNLSPELTVKLYVLDDVLRQSSLVDVERNRFDFVPTQNNVYVSESLMISLRLTPGCRVIMREVERAPEQIEPSSIDLFVAERSALSVKIFENYLRKYSSRQQLLINSNAAVVLEDGRRCVVRLSPEGCDHAEIDRAVLNRLKIHAREMPNDLWDAERKEEDRFRLDKIYTGCLTDLLQECRLTLELGFGLRELPFDYDRQNILICGDVGSGKTTVCKVLAENFRNAPYFAHTHTIDCRSLKGKKVETLQKVVTTALSECVYYQPSVLFLDDLESITSASANDEESTPDATNAARIAYMLENLVTQCQETHYVSIVGTSLSVNRIGQKLRPSRGSQFFRTVFSIPNLDKTHRVSILQSALEDKQHRVNTVNWDFYGNKTEGWVAQDLADMAAKAIFSAWKRNEGSVDSPITVSDEDLSYALNNSTPMSLQGVQLFKGTGHLWADIGGLSEAKSSLVEILQWPLKYPEMFKSAPIKLQSGLLLYGMPGTGKTMLAKAIANECGVNLISVKGPELLSKYVGVSEESVRNVFERAHRAKPCVLFFDEFDSLAPRRGHDSTGVTDRVVNQLLTQMDGVEDRDGVAVVAATSRPDLLDPALLRPGRLDKLLYCPLPDETDREEILAALCKSQKVDTEDVDLKELSKISSGFTGADLNAAITQARLSAFEEAAATNPEKIDAAEIRASRWLHKAVKSVRPSLSSAEKLKYSRIYARFSNGENFIEDILKNQKATLA